jgi:hypothetical protein
MVLLGLTILARGLRLPRGSHDRAFYVGCGLNVLGGFVGAAFVAAVDAGWKLLGA